MERVLTQTTNPTFGPLSLRHMPALIRAWQQRARTRRQLAALDEHQLADIGISPSERMHELEKPFWR
ncbi:DUF1127 domain-containing protein [Stutzerimonas zhaodongensis]|uniref:DUF1127 domain-containing protein n=1 Tax=Stutzerimonas zhaodongensis TaxID=1176257 RepID=A0A3M2HR63_9GAMM|nr:DUF1127 domain-containing protein [Stutzerimonas zhaodongensis]MCQ2030585.1 DUF1127 domain-containing protein [Stutzerimonas zhaodongensis]MCQ4317931.1 DUF1127 domain-containing protein [Stutzerimonas zhaodongensis]RMH88264.1 DUF1127 domain-containing protein [Stutzerimonas zhaodongensis]